MCRVKWRPREPSDPLFAVCGQVDDLVERDPEAAWSLTLEVIAAAGDDRVLAAIAAGPLENILCRSLEQFIDRTELEARRDPKFRRCLTGVWGLSAPAKERLAKYLSAVEAPL